MAEIYGAIHRLTRDDYPRVSRLFDDLSYNLVVGSVVAGNTPAWVYVDDRFGPGTAWIWNRMDTMLLVGETENVTFNRALSALLRERVVPDARDRGIPSLTLHYSPDAWEDKVDHLLPTARLEKTWRRFCQFDDLKVDWREKVPPECVIRRIDEVLLREAQLKNLNSVFGWVHSFWHSVADFAETGFGFCLLRGAAIASWCLTVYASGHDFELGLATAPEHRNRGYATLTAAACAEHSIRRGFTPHWHCDEENLPSIRVAEKVGFSSPTRYPVFRVSLSTG